MSVLNIRNMYYCITSTGTQKNSELEFIISKCTLFKTWKHYTNILAGESSSDVKWHI